jgi:hypothetical protein
MHFLYSVYYELMACICFEHYMLIFMGCCTSIWYFACVLCLLAATRVEVEQFIPARKIPIVVCVAPPEDEQVVPLIHNKLDTKSASR